MEEQSDQGVAIEAEVLQRGGTTFRSAAVFTAHLQRARRGWASAGGPYRPLGEPLLDLLIEPDLNSRHCKLTQLVEEKNVQRGEPAAAGPAAAGDGQSQSAPAAAARGGQMSHEEGGAAPVTTVSSRRTSTTSGSGPRSVEFEGQSHVTVRVSDASPMRSARRSAAASDEAGELRRRLGASEARRRFMRSGGQLSLSQNVADLLATPRGPATSRPRSDKPDTKLSAAENPSSRAPRGRPGLR